MSKLSTIRKQIAALEAQAARIAKEEMDSAIGKVKSLMSDFGLTMEHLTQSVTGKVATKKPKAAARKATARKTASAAKYADPTTGKTWSGFGRAPGWIAGTKNRDAFLVNRSEASTEASAPVASKKKAPAKKVAKAAAAPEKKAAKSVAKKIASVPRKVAKAAKKTGSVVKKAASKRGVSAKKVASRKAASKKAATPSSAPTPGAASPAAE